MHVFEGCGLLLILIFIFRLSRGYVIHSRPYSKVEKTNAGSGKSSNYVHNLTIGCERQPFLNENVLQC